MSFYVDDDDFQQSTEFKCQSNDTQRAYREAITRALKYARGEGVSLVAALGNSDINLASDAARGGKKCKVVPAQSKGVIGTVALGPNSEKASYSSWGMGWADVSAPGGNGTTGDCLNTVLSTIPGGAYGCFQGTSMASPHTTGVAALIISQFGKSKNGNWQLGPDKVNYRLVESAVDIGAAGRDKCFGYGRIDALRAVNGATNNVYDGSTPKCTETT
jgi:subtilisin family serine protease